MIVVLDNVFEADEYTSGRIFIGKSSTATTGTGFSFDLFSFCLKFLVQFENIFKNKPQQATQVVKKRKAPLYDVNNPDAFILYTPPKSKEEVEVAVVLDPRLRRYGLMHNFIYFCKYRKHHYILEAKYFLDL